MSNDQKNCKECQQINRSKSPPVRRNKEKKKHKKNCCDKLVGSCPCQCTAKCCHKLTGKFLGKRRDKYVKEDEEEKPKNVKSKIRWFEKIFTSECCSNCCKKDGKSICAIHNPCSPNRKQKKDIGVGDDGDRRRRHGGRSGRWWRTDRENQAYMRWTYYEPSCTTAALTKYKDLHGSYPAWSEGDMQGRPSPSVSSWMDKIMVGYVLATPHGELLPGARKHLLLKRSNSFSSDDGNFGSTESLDCEGRKFRVTKKCYEPVPVKAEKSSSSITIEKPKKIRMAYIPKNMVDPPSESYGETLNSLDKSAFRSHRLKKYVVLDDEHDSSVEALI